MRMNIYFFFILLLSCYHHLVLLFRQCETFYPFSPLIFFFQTLCKSLQTTNMSQSFVHLFSSFRIYSLAETHRVKLFVYGRRLLCYLRLKQTDQTIRTTMSCISFFRRAAGALAQQQ